MKLEKTFGDTLKKLREEKQLTLREVAKELDIDTSMLGKIEKGNRNPSKKFITKTAKFFEVSERDLKIAFLSDTVAYQVLDREDYANEILRVAEKKIKYKKAKRK